MNFFALKSYQVGSEHGGWIVQFPLAEDMSSFCLSDDDRSLRIVREWDRQLLAEGWCGRRRHGGILDKTEQVDFNKLRIS